MLIERIQGLSGQFRNAKVFVGYRILQSLFRLRPAYQPQAAYGILSDYCIIIIDCLAQCCDSCRGLEQPQSPGRAFPDKAVFILT